MGALGNPTGPGSKTEMSWQCTRERSGVNLERTWQFVALKWWKESGSQEGWSVSDGETEFHFKPAIKVQDFQMQACDGLISGRRAIALGKQTETGSDYGRRQS